MPVYEGSVGLNDDEWILFQVKEGPCSAGCDYCYENEHIKRVLAGAQTRGEVAPADLEGMTTLDLARFTERYRKVIGSEMEIDEIRHLFAVLKEAGIDRAGLIGSEPTSHSQFGEILEAARSLGLGLLVYTSGLNLDALRDEAVRFVVLHLDYGRLGAETLRRRVEEGSLPPPAYMKKIEGLLRSGKEVHLRINFTSSDLPESGLVVNFFAQVPAELHAACLLKYSFSTRVAGDHSFAYYTPESLRWTSPSLLEFVDRFAARFPAVRMISERPLFPCSFDPETWRAYEAKGGFLATCDMEFTFYPGRGLALCPPSRDLACPEVVRTAEDLGRRIGALRQFLRANYLKPSFDACVPCEWRTNLLCQGGCLGYKVESPVEEPRLVQLTAR